MANCLKCGKHMHICNVSRFYPKCGTDMSFNSYAVMFFHETEMSEISMAMLCEKFFMKDAAVYALSDDGFCKSICEVTLK